MNKKMTVDEPASESLFHAGYLDDSQGRRGWN